MAKRTRRKTTGRKVDFSEAVKWFEPDIEVGVEIKAATWEDGAEYPYIAVELKGIDEEYEDSTMFHNATTSPKALDRLRTFLEAFGMEVPEGELEIDTEELVGRQAMCHTYEDRYTKQDGSKGTSVKPDDFWPLEDEDDKKKSSKKGAGGKKSKEPELLDRDEVEGMDRDDLEGLVEEHDLDVDLKNRKIKRNDEALLEAVIAALEEKELLEEAEKEEEKTSRRGKKDEGKSSSKGRRGKKDEEEEETSRSKRGSKGSKKKSSTWSADDIGEMSEEELDDVVEQGELEIDLSDFSTLRKKKNAVIDALEEADKLSD